MQQYKGTMCLWDLRWAYPDPEEGRAGWTPGTGIFPIMKSMTSDLWYVGRVFANEPERKWDRKRGEHDGEFGAKGEKILACTKLTHVHIYKHMCDKLKHHRQPKSLSCKASHTDTLPTDSPMVLMTASCSCLSSWALIILVPMLTLPS